MLCRSGYPLCIKGLSEDLGVDGLQAVIESGRRYRRRRPMQVVKLWFRPFPTTLPLSYSADGPGRIRRKNKSCAISQEDGSVGFQRCRTRVALDMHGDTVLARVEVWSDVEYLCEEVVVVWSPLELPWIVPDAHQRPSRSCRLEGST